MKTSYILIGIGIFLGLIVMNSSFYILNEMEQVIITQFGKPIGDPIGDPGIHVKAPFIQDLHTFDKRFLEWDGDANQLPTKDKRFIWVDSYARWRIADPLLFFQRVRDERGAYARLDDILDGETRNAVANHELVELIRSTNRKPAIDADTVAGEESDIFPTISIGRQVICNEIMTAAAARTLELGIELLDLRFKRLDYVDEVRQKVYERMIAERKRIADKFRSEGQGQAAKILGDKERELKRIESEAYRTAQEIVGEADGKATAIYARIYNQSPESRDFYRFIKTLETYRSTFSGSDWLILSTKSELYRYFEKQSGQ